VGNTGIYFEDWMAKTVPYGKKLSRDGVGKVTYASDVNLDCYALGMLIKVVNDKGEEIISQEQLYFVDIDDTVEGIDFEDRFNMGTVATPRYRPIKSIEKFFDEDGDLDLLVVYL